MSEQKFQIICKREHKLNTANPCVNTANQGSQCKDKQNNKTKTTRKKQQIKNNKRKTTPQKQQTLCKDKKKQQEKNNKKKTTPQKQHPKNNTPKTTRKK